MPQRLTYKDNQTGREVSFDWHDDVNPPTDAELEEVFREAGQLRPVHPLDIAHPESGIRKLPGRIANWAYENPATTGAMIGGAIAAPFTAGASIPITGAIIGGGSAIGAGLGQGVQEVREGADGWEAARDITKSAVGEGLAGGVLGAAGPVMKWGGRELYRAALRPTLEAAPTLKSVDALIDTGLREGINVSQGGVAKIERTMREVDKNLNKLIADLEGTVDPQRGLAKIAAFKKKRLKEGALEDELAQLDDVARQYSERYANPMQPADAQQLKVGIGRKVQDYYDTVNHPGRVDARMEYRSGLREGLESLDKSGELGKINQRRGELEDLQFAINRPASRTPVAGTVEAAALISGGPTAAIPAAIGRSSLVRSALGRGLHTVGSALDPRTIRPMAAHTPEPTGIQPWKATMDELGMPEVPGSAWAPDQLDSMGIPTSRGEVDMDAAWLQRVAEPRPFHTGPQPPLRDPVTLDTVGVPEVPGSTYAPDPLDAAGVPVEQAVLEAEELWLRRFPQLQSLPEQERRALIREALETGTYQPTLPSVPAVRYQPKPRTTKSEIQALYQRYISGQ